MRVQVLTTSLFSNGKAAAAAVWALLWALSLKSKAFSLLDARRPRATGDRSASTVRAVLQLFAVGLLHCRSKRCTYGSCDPNAHMR